MRYCIIVPVENEDNGRDAKPVKITIRRCTVERACYYFSTLCRSSGDTIKNVEFNIEKYKCTVTGCHMLECRVKENLCIRNIYFMSCILVYTLNLNVLHCIIVH